MHRARRLPRDVDLLSPEHAEPKLQSPVAELQRCIELNETVHRLLPRPGVNRHPLDPPTRLQHSAPERELNVASAGASGARKTASATVRRRSGSSNDPKAQR